MVLNAYKTAKKETPPVYPCVSLCIPVYPYVSTCIPTPTPFFPFQRKGKNKREKGKVSADFAGISQGFRGIIRQEIVSLFSKKGENKREKGKFLGISGDFAGISCEEIPSLFSEKGKLKGKRENAEGWLICLIGV